MSQNILVTGTSSGFGRLIALDLARKGHRVFATMRNLDGKSRPAAEELRRIAKTEELKLSIVEMELASEDSVNAAVAGVIEQAGHLDVVVNNAGFSAVGLEETLTSAQIQRQFEVNVFGPHRVARAVLPSMRARRQGLLIQVSSVLGRLVFPFMGAYCASKAALEALFDAYRYELKPTGVESTLVQPGAFPTDFAKNGDVGAEQDRAAGYGPLANGLQTMFAGLEQMLSGPNAPSPQLVSDAITKLVDSPAGTRPSRVVVDPMTGPVAEGLNKAHHETQTGVLGGMGMGGLTG